MERAIASGQEHARTSTAAALIMVSAGSHLYRYPIKRMRMPQMLLRQIRDLVCQSFALLVR
jgi:hypothetical protein